MSKRAYFVIFLDAFLISAVLARKAVIGFFVDLLPSCIFFEKGILCPSCGGTSATYHFFAGNFKSAFLFNPFIFLCILYVIALVLLLNCVYVFRVRALKKPLYIMANYRAVIIAAVCYAVFGIARNFI